jgi:hypothetical protein
MGKKKFFKNPKRSGKQKNGWKKKGWMSTKMAGKYKKGGKIQNGGKIQKWRENTKMAGKWWGASHFPIELRVEWTDRVTTAVTSCSMRAWGECTK